MIHTLNGEAWEFLLGLVSRIHCAETYGDACDVFFRGIRELIPYTASVICMVDSSNGSPQLQSPVSATETPPGNEFFILLGGDYPHWRKFFGKQYSQVYRLSKIVPDEEWTESRVYKDVWQPRGLVRGMFATLKHDGQPLAVVGLARGAEEDDFSELDKYIMEQLRDPLELKFYSLVEGKWRSAGAAARDERVNRMAVKYDLTKREKEILALTCAGKSSEVMCEELCITHATLSKHLSNIYSKTKVRNRTQLFGLFSKNF